jgi:2-methylisocitrate lyase-like PEP mutase family enzyme
MAEVFISATELGPMMQEPRLRAQSLSLLPVPTTRFDEAAMTRSTTEKRFMFRALHEQGCFVIPNPWDIGSARYLQGLGFRALATTSSGFAWSRARSDTEVLRDPVLEHIREIVESTDLPVSADFGNGYAMDPNGVESNVKMAIETGIAGLSIEDSTGDPNNPLFEIESAVDRIRAARSAIDQTGGDTLLVGRAENFLVGRPDLDDTIARLVAYAEAGADCLYAPYITTREQITAVVQAVAPKPVNVVIRFANDLPLETLIELGVRRVSVGGTLARTAWGGFMQAAQALAQGSFEGFTNAASGQQLDGFFRISGDDPLVRQPAHIIGEVNFRQGEGPLRTIPRGIVQVETTPTDAVFTWQDDQAHAIAAMPVANLCQYIADGVIVVANKPPLPN